MNAPSVRCLVFVLVLSAVSVTARYCDAAALYLPQEMSDYYRKLNLSGISDDGTTVVGTKHARYGNIDPVVVGTEYVRYGDIDSVHYPIRLFVDNQSIVVDGYPGGPIAVSGDGSVVVGNWYSDDANFQGTQPYRWTQQGGVELLGILDDRERGSYAQDVSNNGEVVVGNSYSESGDTAFYWTEQTGISPLGVLESHSQSHAEAISANGNVAVGFSGTDTTREAFRWTSEGGMEGLGRLEGKFDSYAEDVSADGSIIVGWSGARYDTVTPYFGVPGDEAFIWTENEGMRGLGFLPGHSWSHATAISADGSTVVGISAICEDTGDFLAVGPWEAFIWDAEHGMRSLDALLSEQYGLDLPDWSLGTPVGISADGSVIIGENDTTVFENVSSGCLTFGSSWIAVIPEPSSYIMIWAGILACALFRRSKSRNLTT